MNLSAINLFDGNFKQLSMNNSIKVEKFEPEPTFENTSNEIKDNIWKVSPLLPWICQLFLFLKIKLNRLVWTEELK